MPTLREFWEELKRAQSGCADAASPSSAHVATSSAHGSGSRRGSSRLGSGSGGELLGYGLDLVAPDQAAEERVMMILRKLCEQDAQRLRQREKADLTDNANHTATKSGA